MKTLILPNSKLYKYRYFNKNTYGARTRFTAFDFRKSDIKIENPEKINVKLTLNGAKNGTNIEFRPHCWPEMYKNINTLEINIENVFEKLQSVFIDFSLLKSFVKIENLIINLNCECGEFNFWLDELKISKTSDSKKYFAQLNGPLYTNIKNLTLNIEKADGWAFWSLNSQNFENIVINNKQHIYYQDRDYYYRHNYLMLLNSKNLKNLFIKNYKYDFSRDNNEIYESEINNVELSNILGFLRIDNPNTFIQIQNFCCTHPNEYFDLEMTIKNPFVKKYEKMRQKISPKLQNGMKVDKFYKELNQLNKEAKKKE